MGAQIGSAVRSDLRSCGVAHQVQIRSGSGHTPQVSLQVVEQLGEAITAPCPIPAAASGVGVFFYFRFSSTKLLRAKRMAVHIVHRNFFAATCHGMRIVHANRDNSGCNCPATEPSSFCSFFGSVTIYLPLEPALASKAQPASWLCLHANRLGRVVEGWADLHHSLSSMLLPAVFAFAAINSHILNAIDPIASLLVVLVPFSFLT